MCGRFSETRAGEEVARAFMLAHTPELVPRYNIAPTQPVAVVLTDRPEDPRTLRHMRWGFVPSWADDIAIGNRMINARGETLAEKPAFKAAYKRRRCLVVADGFYEWKKDGSKKQPHYIQVDDGNLFAMAGLWEIWGTANGDMLETCTIVTTEPNELMASIHDRMPVILDPADYDLWLEVGEWVPDGVQDLLKPFDADRMKAVKVSSYVNSPRNDSRRCLEPPMEQGLLF